jgi:hypothetical protein
MREGHSHSRLVHCGRVSMHDWWHSVLSGRKLRRDVPKYDVFRSGPQAARQQA